MAASVARSSARVSPRSVTVVAAISATTSCSVAATERTAPQIVEREQEEGGEAAVVPANFSVQSAAPAPAVIAPAVPAPAVLVPATPAVAAEPAKPAKLPPTAFQSAP